jgi:hypothetical protein
MNRQNLFSDVWDGENEEAGTRHRIFWRPDDARMGATLYELGPDAPEMRIHMHFGADRPALPRRGSDRPRRPRDRRPPNRGGRADARHRQRLRLHQPPLPHPPRRARGQPPPRRLPRPREPGLHRELVREAQGAARLALRVRNPRPSEKGDRRLHRRVPPPPAQRPPLPNAGRGAQDLGEWSATTENSGLKCRARRGPGQVAQLPNPLDSSGEIAAVGGCSAAFRRLRRRPALVSLLWALPSLWVGGSRRG